MLSRITVSPSPHISKAHSTRSIMLDVIIALVPAMAMAWWYFRTPAIIIIGVCVAACAATEWLCCVILKRRDTLNDLSAVVTGIILALSLPAAVPFWAAIIGSVFAIAIGKMVFGGLGSNIFNPAMVGRAFLTASFGMMMTTWTVPATIDPGMVTTPKSGISSGSITISADNKSDDSIIQAVTQATPLAWSKQAIKGKVEADIVNVQIRSAFTGQVGGCLGETSVVALLIGAAYMVIRRTINLHISTAVLASAFVFAGIGYLIKPAGYVSPILHLTSGGMLLCAFFIATDPVTAPLTTRGMWIFGIGTGALIMLIRMVGEYPEGVMFAILIMNAITPLIDRFCKLVPYGGKVDA